MSDTFSVLQEDRLSTTTSTGTQTDKLHNPEAISVKLYSLIVCVPSNTQRVFHSWRPFASCFGFDTFDTKEA